MTIQRYGLGREYAGNTGSPAITEQADGAYVRYEDFQRMEAGHNSMHELLALRTRKAEAAHVAAKVRDWPKIQAHIKEYVDGYELIGEDDQGRDGCHTPTAGERALIEDAIHGLLGEPDFDTLYHPQPAGPLKEAMDGGLLQEFLDAAKKDGITHLAFAQSAEPAKVLSDADVAELARAHNISSTSRGIRAYSDIIDFTRALLKRAQPASGEDAMDAARYRSIRAASCENDTVTFSILLAHANTFVDPEKPTSQEFDSMADLSIQQEVSS